MLNIVDTGDPGDDSSSNNQQQMEHDGDYIDFDHNDYLPINNLNINSSNDTNNYNESNFEQTSQNIENEGDKLIINNMEQNSDENSNNANVSKSDQNMGKTLQQIEDQFYELDQLLNKQFWTTKFPYFQMEQNLAIAIQLMENGDYDNTEDCKLFVFDTVYLFVKRVWIDDNFQRQDADDVDSKILCSISFKLIDIIVKCLKKKIYRHFDLIPLILTTGNRFSCLNYYTNSSEYSKSYAICDKYQNILLIHLINYFGNIGGFDIWLSYFENSNLTPNLIIKYLDVIGSCFDLLHQDTRETFILPAFEIIIKFYENLSTEYLKNELISDSKLDLMTKIAQQCKIYSVNMQHNEKAKEFEFVKLKLTLRMLRLPSFNGKMISLNEMNKIISYYNCDEKIILITRQEMASWLLQNNVLGIILNDFLHQPQYVEKLDDIIRFLLRENALSTDNLKQIWDAKLDKHEIIVKNIHDLIAKLAWNFSPNQLNFLFSCFKSSWSNASKKEREKLLELMRKLAEDDKDGSMAVKVLSLLWNIAYNDDEVDSEIVDQAVSAHLKILDSYCKTCHKDLQKFEWIEKCIEEINRSYCGNNVITAMQQIREICMLFPISQPINKIVSSAKKQFIRPENRLNRRELLITFNEKFDIPAMLIKSLTLYMNWMKDMIKQDPAIDPNVVCKGRRFSHCEEVQSRLDFLKFFLKVGDYWLGISQANEIWNCLAQNAIFPTDKKFCFQWFSSLMSSESDLQPDIFLSFFESNIIKLDPSLLDIYGVECFEKFFKAINYSRANLSSDNHIYYMEDRDLIGMDYLWKMILFCDDIPATKAIDLLKELYTNLGDDLLKCQSEIQNDLINTCFDRLKASYDTLSVIGHDNDETRIQFELKKMTRVLLVIYEYINKFDNDFPFRRTLPPMSQCIRGEETSLTVKIGEFTRNVEEFKMFILSNETFSSIKHRILVSCRVKIAQNVDIEFYSMGEKIDLAMIKSPSQLTHKQKLNLVAKFTVLNTIHFPMDSDWDPVPNEFLLPGVIISAESQHINFLFAIADLAISLKCDFLREKCLLVLNTLPPDSNYSQLIVDFASKNKSGEDLLNLFKQHFSSPTKTVYFLKIIYALLVPVIERFQSISNDFQISFLTNNCHLQIINFLTDKSLNVTDNYLKITALLMILRISKFSLTTVCYMKIKDSKDTNSHLKTILQEISNELFSGIKRYSRSCADHIQHKQLNGSIKNDWNFIPNSQLINAVLKVAWFTGTGNPEFDFNTNKSILHDSFIQNYSTNNNNDNNSTENLPIYDVCNEAIELLTLLLMLSPSEINNLIRDDGEHFFIDLLLLCPNELVRNNIYQHFGLILTICMNDIDIQENILKLMFNILKEYLPKFYQTSSEYFKLFCKLLQYSFSKEYQHLVINELLQYECELLINPKKNFFINDQYEEILLEGHMKVTKELIKFLNCEQKIKIGLQNTNQPNSGLVYLLMDNYLFTASKSLCLFQKNEEIGENIYPVCSGSKATIAAFELLVALSIDCAENLAYICKDILTYLNTFSIHVTWDYVPDIGTRPNKGFVGLKNAGATCYMNSVLQQLFMISEVRNGILSVNLNSSYYFDDNNDEAMLSDDNKPEQDEKSYNIGILKQLQIIFGHLLSSPCQYYAPKGLWQNFRFVIGQVNHLREQQDALEFFNRIIDSLDEALKVLNQEPLMSNIFGGLFSDQKICKDCPHRYFREESFTTLCVDVRNHQSLNDSLEEYVRGDLLEGDNAYFCERCNCKVATVKRLCIKKLPNVLVIQLKRFDFDYERNVPIKFNDYFEFPRILDMEPFTVNGLARKEGEIIEEDLIKENNNNTEYELIGIVVHSGQANGGHYYSFINHNDDNQKKWYKFDDVDVNECKLELDEEMRHHCFGGESNYEQYDSRKMPMKLQSRCWNAFILVYRLSSNNLESISANKNYAMPMAIQKNVLHQNALFMHQKTLFSEEFYHFMRCLFESNKNFNQTNLSQTDTDKIINSILSVFVKFLFTFCFRTRKTLRVGALQWYELLLPYLNNKPTIQTLFIEHYLLETPNIFFDFILDCPFKDVRSAFSKIILSLTNFLLLKNDLANADKIMSILVPLAIKEVPDRIKQSNEYFEFFYSYALLGFNNRKHLLKFHVASYFISLAIEFSSSFSIRSQYLDDTLFQVVSVLVRSCDISGYILNKNNRLILPNKFMFDENENYITTLPENIYDSLFIKKFFTKKIIKEYISLEENKKLMQFCCWENDEFSRYIIDEFLSLINNSYNHELDPYFVFMNKILKMNDSFQKFRIEYLLVGDKEAPNNKPPAYLCDKYIPNGIFEYLRNQNFFVEKRIYQCMHFLMNLFQELPLSYNLVNSQPTWKHKWTLIAKWIQNEMSKKYCDTNWGNTNTQLYGTGKILVEKALKLFNIENLPNGDANNLNNNNNNNNNNNINDNGPKTATTTTINNNNDDDNDIKMVIESDIPSATDNNNKENSDPEVVLQQPCDINITKELTATQQKRLQIVQSLNELVNKKMNFNLPMSYMKFLVDFDPNDESYRYYMGTFCIFTFPTMNNLKNNPLLIIEAQKQLCKYFPLYETTKQLINVPWCIATQSFTPNTGQLYVIYYYIDLKTVTEEEFKIIKIIKLPENGQDIETMNIDMAGFAKYVSNG